MISLYVLLVGYLTLTLSDIRTRSVSVMHISMIAVISILSVFITQSINRDLIVKMIGGLLVGVLLFLFLCLPGILGHADGIMFVITGCVTGYLVLLQVFILAITLLSIYAAILLLLHKVTTKQQIPFMPFLCLSFLGVILCG